MNSRPMNYDTWSYIISIGQGYLVNYIVSTKFLIVTSYLSLYSVILDHPVTISSIVTDLRFKMYSFTCINMK